MPNYERMSTERLKELSLKLTLQRDKLSATHKELAAVLSGRASEEQARAKLEAMSPAERAVVETLIKKSWWQKLKERL